MVLLQPLSRSDRSRTWVAGASLVALLAACGCGSGKGTTDGSGVGGGAGDRNVGGAVGGHAGGMAGGAGGTAGTGTGGQDAAPACDPALCTMPPAAKCQEDSNDFSYSVISYTGTPTCTTLGTCFYPPATTPCDYGCYLGQCTAELASLTNVQGTDASGPVSLTGGGVAANTVVTVTARTSPRGAAQSVAINSGTCSASTLCVLTFSMFMNLDPKTPAGQTSYDQWTANFPGQSAGTTLEFQLQATAAGAVNPILSEASTGVPWSFTSN